MFSFSWLKRKKQKEEIEPEEIFMDSVNLPFFDGVRDEGRIEKPIMPRIFFLWSMVVAFGLLIIVGRTAELQIIRGKELLAASRENISIAIFSAPPRGIIYDRNMRPLASNSASFSLVLKKGGFKNNRDFKENLERLSGLLGRDVYTLWFEGVSKSATIKGFPDDIYLAEEWPEEAIVMKNVPRPLLLRVATNPADFPGVSIAETISRYYSLGSAGSHVVGFTSSSGEAGIRTAGKSGIELFYEDRLRGSPGKKIIEINAEGEKLRERFITEPTPGQSVVLNIDGKLQRSLYDILARVIRALGKRAGAAVVSDPRDGRIIAMASFPGFDADALSRGSDRESISKILTGEDKPLFNRAISGNYSPGSTVKPILAAGALDQKIVDPNFSIYDEGFISVPNPYDPTKESIFKDWAKLGWVDMRRAIAFSANVYFYTIGGGHGNVRGLGIEGIRRILFGFGFGSLLGIDLFGEHVGLVPGPEEKKATRPDDSFWRLGDTYITSIGQGDMGATPLQVNFATAAIANGGKLFRPLVARTILGENGVIVEEVRPEIIREHVADPESLEIVREGMRLAVTEGSARAFADFPLAVAGKTGTAQTGIVGKNHGWFTAFAPYQNPEIVVTVLVEEGTGGSTDAVPIAKEILWAWLAVRNSAAASNAQGAVDRF